MSYARAMHTAHKCGVIHRDLKPANVLLTADGTPKITDFGLAKRVDTDASQTVSGAVLGTPQYMPPEQARAHTRLIGPLSDVYALGALLYEALTGRPPFQAATVYDTLGLVVSAEPLPPSRLQPAVPRDLETICLKCLQKDPAKRYASALALAEDLDRFLADKPILARRTPPWERAVKWVRRRPAIAALIAVSAVALLSSVAGALLYLNQRNLYLNQQNRDLQQQVINAEREEHVRKSFAELHGAVAIRDWVNAKIHLERVLANIDPDEPSLHELHEKALALGAEIQHALDDLQARQKAQGKYQEFIHDHHEKALFHGSMATGEDELANLKTTQEEVWKALRLFGVTLDAQDPPTLETSFTKSEKTDIIAGCYELLLILCKPSAATGAEASGPVPHGSCGFGCKHCRFLGLAGGANTVSGGLGPFPGKMLLLALHILDRAETLGYPDHPTQAYHLRRARILEEFGDKEAAEAKQAGGHPATSHRAGLLLAGG